MESKEIHKEMIENKSPSKQCSRPRCHRYLPLVCEEVVDADGSADPFRLMDMAGAEVLALRRGFFGALDSLGVEREAPSFTTILAWISSNFAALTFFGQNRVTNLWRDEHKACQHEAACSGR